MRKIHRTGFSNSPVVAIYFYHLVLIDFHLLTFQDDRSLEPTVYGRIASYYYLSHLTLRMYKSRLQSELTIEDVLQILVDVQEYAELPVRHNEDQMNA